MILEAMVGDQVGHHLVSLAQMFVPVIGTALPVTVGLTTLQAAQVASNVECTKMILVVALILTFLALEALAVAAIALVGNLGIGSAPGI